MKAAVLGEVAMLGSGGTPKRSVAEYFGAGTPWVSITDMDDGIVETTRESLTRAGLTNSAAKTVPAGTLLVAMYGASIGKLGIAGRPLCTSQAIAFIQPKPDTLDDRYLYHYMLAQRPVLRARGRGGAQPNISLGDLQAWPIPLPPVDEQRRVAAILDHADVLRVQRRESARKYASLAEAIFFDMFGDPVANSRGWARGPFGEVCETRLGKMLDAKQQTGKDARPYLRNANVQWFSFDLSSIYEMDIDQSSRSVLRLEPGDVLICEGGEPGRSAIWRAPIDEMYFQKALHRARPRAGLATPEFVAYLMRALVTRGGLKDYVTSATIGHLTGAKLKGMPIILPDFDLQLAFSDRLAAIDTSIARVQTAAEGTNNLLSSLQSRAFSSQL